MTVGPTITINNGRTIVGPTIVNYYVIMMYSNNSLS